MKHDCPPCPSSPLFQLLLSCNKSTWSLVKSVRGWMTSVVWLQFRVTSLKKWCSKRLLFCEDMDLRTHPDSLQVGSPNSNLFACVILHYSTHSLLSIGVCGMAGWVSVWVWVLVGMVVGVGVGVSVGVLLVSHWRLSILQPLLPSWSMKHRQYTVNVAVTTYVHRASLLSSLFMQ